MAILIIFCSVLIQCKVNISKSNKSSRSNREIFELKIKESLANGEPLVILENIDLENSSISIGPVELVFKGGMIYNGTLIGHGALHTSELVQCYENVHWEGDWRNRLVYLEWFTDDFSDAEKNFRLVKEVLKFGRELHLKTKVPIKISNWTRDIGRNRDVYITGDGRDSTGLILESKSPNEYVGYFSHINGSNLNLRNLTIWTRDYLESGRSNAEADYIFCGNYFNIYNNNNAKPTIDSIIIDSCSFYGSVRLAHYGSSSSNKRLAEFRTSNSIDLLRVKNSYFEYCNAPFGFANMGYKYVLISENEFRNFSAAILGFSASGIDEGYYSTLYASRGFIEFSNNLLQNDHLVDVPSGRALTSLIVKGGDGRLEFTNNKLLNLLSDVADGEVFPFYFTCTSKGDIVVRNNIVSDVVCRGSISRPATLVKQRGASRFYLIGNRFTLSENALRLIGVISNSRSLADLSGNDFYYEFMQVGTSELLTKEYVIRENYFSMPFVNRSSEIMDAASFIFEGNIVNIERFSESGISSIVSADCTLFYARHRLNLDENSNPGRFISRNKIVIASTDCENIRLYHFGQGTQIPNGLNEDPFTNYSEVRILDTVYLSGSTVVMDVFDTDFQEVGMLIEGKNVSYGIADRSDGNHRRPSAKKFESSVTMYGFENSINSSPFTITPNSKQILEMYENFSDTINITSFRSDLAYYKLRGDLPLQIIVRILNENQDSSESIGFSFVLDDKFRNIHCLDNSGNYLYFNPNIGEGRRFYVASKNGDGRELFVLTGEGNDVDCSIGLTGMGDVRSCRIFFECKELGFARRSSADYLDVLSRFYGH